MNATTSNPNCPSCQKDRVHIKADWDAYHELAGHGYSPESGMTHSSIPAARIEELQRGELHKRAVQIHEEAKQLRVDSTGF